MSNQSGSFWMSQKGLAALGLIGAATYFLLIEHRQHLFQWLPFLILLACPLMHIFMHGGHGHGGKSSHGAEHAGGEAEEGASHHGQEDGKKQTNHEHHH